MAEFTYRGLLQPDDLIFKEPVTRFPARPARRSVGSTIAPPVDTDGTPTDQAVPESRPDKPKPALLLRALDPLGRRPYTRAHE